MYRILSKRGGGKLSSKYLMRVLSVYSSNKGNTCPCMPEFCPLYLAFNGGDQVVTDGSLRHSQGGKIEYSTLNTINESISFDLAFLFCLTWLHTLVEIIGNSFFYDLVI